VNIDLARVHPLIVVETEFSLEQKFLELIHIAQIIAQGMTRIVALMAQVISESGY
jgi:hypothetical protein